MTPHAPSSYGTLQLASVVANDDPDGRGRVRVRLSALEVELWAVVATTSAGQNYGVQTLPRIEEIVVVGFLDPEFPIVLGSLWTGSNPVPEDVTPIEDKYAIQTPSGSSITMNDAEGPSITVKSPNGQKVTVTDDGGGKVEVDVQGTRIEVTSSGIRIEASGNVEIQAGQASVSAGMLQVDAGMSKFSGVVQCDTLIATSVVGSTYTPGAGNIW